RDLDRRDAVIARHVREQQWARRLPRAAQLPPVRGLAGMGERFDDDHQLPPWLEPENLIIPPAMMRRCERASWRRRVGRIGILIVGVCALPITYYFVGGWPPRSESHPLASSVTKPAAPPAPSPTSLPILAQDDEPEPPDANESASRAKPPRAARLSERLAMVSPAIGALSPKPAVRALDADAISLLMKRGEQLFEAGDFA